MMISIGSDVKAKNILTIKVYQSNPNISYNLGKVAVGWGPFVYCIEKID